MNQFVPSAPEAGSNFVNLCEISPWECCNRYIRVNYSKFIKKTVHNIRLAAEFAVVGAAVGVLAYHNFRSYNNVFSNILSYPAKIFKGVAYRNLAGLASLGSIGAFLGYKVYANNH